MNANLSWFLKTYCQKKLFVSFVVFLLTVQSSAVVLEHQSLWSVAHLEHGAKQVRVEFLITSKTECRTELKSQLDDHILTECGNGGKEAKQCTQLGATQQSQGICNIHSSWSLKPITNCAQSSILRALSHLSLPQVPVSHVFLHNSFRCVVFLSENYMHVTFVRPCASQGKGYYT